jgi:hypothetical protein
VSAPNQRWHPCRRGSSGVVRHFLTSISAGPFLPRSAVRSAALRCGHRGLGVGVAIRVVGLGAGYHVITHGIAVPQPGRINRAHQAPASHLPAIPLDKAHAYGHPAELGRTTIVAFDPCAHWPSECSPPFEDVHTIGVLTASGIGDFVMTVPALSALRATYPAAELVVLGDVWHPGFLDGRPGPWSGALAVPRTDGVCRLDEDPLSRLRDFDARHRGHFDLLVQLHGGRRSEQRSRERSQPSSQRRSPHARR